MDLKENLTKLLIEVTNNISAFRVLNSEDEKDLEKAAKLLSEISGLTDNNPENYRRIPTCWNCNEKEIYLANGREYYSCRFIDGDDAEPDHVCGNHPDILCAPLKYNKVKCCFNCDNCQKSWLIPNKLKYYECMLTAKSVDDGSEVDQDHVCKFYEEES